MEKLAENNLTYFYLSHVVIVVTAVTTINLTPVVIGVEHQVSNFSAITSTRTSGFGKDFKTFCQSETKLHMTSVYFSGSRGNEESL
jgi:hypothetical protein